MNKKKVLFLIESLSGGGAEKVLVTLVNNLDRSKFDITLCCVVNTGKYVSTLNSDVHYTYIIPDINSLKGFKRWYYSFLYHLVYQWLPLKWVYKLFVPQNKDVEVAFVEGFATKLLSYSTNRKSKKIAWIHTDLNNNHWTKLVYKNIKEEQMCYQQYNQIITVSDTALSAFKRIFKEVRIPIQTLYNPIDSNEILSKGKEKISCIKTSKIRLVSVGRLVHQKAYDRLLRIVNLLIQQNYPIELWIIGEGEERSKLESYIRENGLGKVVTLWGFQTNPYAYLKYCDLFVCSSVSEGYSTAVTEALILGLPVITTDCSGMNELLLNGKWGVITENSEDALYLGLKNILEHPDLLGYYKYQAQDRGKDFSLLNLLSPIEKILLQ